MSLPALRVIRERFHKARIPILANACYVQDRP
jgi:hypothetical protein